MSVLQEIVDRILPGIPGVDWSVLEERFGMPREELVHHSGGDSPELSGALAYDAYIVAARNRAEAQLNQILMSFQVEDDPTTRENEMVAAMQAWEGIREQELLVGQELLLALRTGQSLLPSSSPLRLDLEDYRAFITYVYIVCLYSTLIHLKKLPQFSDMSGKDIVRNADSLTRMWNALALLGEKGGLDPLKRPEARATSGAPVVIVVSISVVILAAIVTYLVVTVREQAMTNKFIGDICDKATKDNDAKLMEHCIDLTRINAIARKAPLVGDPGQGISNSIENAGKALLVVAAGYLLFRLVTAGGGGKPKSYRMVEES